jgi:DNA-binding CsgD family transcriptional regulator
MAIALLLLFQLSKYSLWYQPAHWELYLVLLGALFVSIGIGLSRFFSLGLNPEKQPTETAPISEDSSIEINQSQLDATGLSKREYEILLLIADGLSNSEIAHQLFISESTVKTHVSKILFKLDAKRRTQAVQIGRALNII